MERYTENELQSILARFRNQASIIRFAVDNNLLNSPIVVKRLQDLQFDLPQESIDSCYSESEW